MTTYGQTETGSGIVYDGTPLPGVELRLGDGQGSGDEGEILVRGPMLLRGYRDGSDPRLAGGWLPTGDAGRLGPDGGRRLRTDGRSHRDRGEKVGPLPSRTAGHLVGRGRGGGVETARPEWGERVVAWVVPADRALPPTLEELRQVVGARLPPWAAPRQLVVVDGLPRTASGKVARQRLR